MRSARTEKLLFPEDPVNRSIADRFKNTIRDRKIARRLMYADASERETIEMLMITEPELTLYEAIALCIRYPEKD